MKRPLVALSAFALLAAACSSPGGKTAESTPATTATGTSSAIGVSSGAVPKTIGRLGDTLDLTRADGSRVGVTLVQIINPASIAHGPGEPGKAYVATKMTIKDPGTATIEGDVNVNVSVVGSNDQSYTPDLNNVTECTNFESGAFRLDPGESVTGCVVFALPPGVTPARVKYVPSAGFADDFGEWLVS
ncbi:MAG: hypothetical protein ABI307_14965 [Mycobacterium sp.]